MSENVDAAEVLRVAITGAQGAGKSTLGSALERWARRQLDPRARLYAGLGDAVFAGLDAIERTQPAARVRAFVAAHLAREAALEPGLALLDRCLLDAAAYAQVLACLPAGEWSALEDRLRASMAATAAVLVVPIAADYPVLAEADESPAFRRRIETAILALGQRLAAPLVMLDGDARRDQRRARRVLRGLWLGRPT